MDPELVPAARAGNIRVAEQRTLQKSIWSDSRERGTLLFLTTDGGTFAATPVRFGN